MDLYSDQLVLNASLIGSFVDDILNICISGGLFKVHSVFERVVNIRTPQGLISVVTQSIGKAASYITLNHEIDFKSFNIEAGDAVILDNKCLIFGNLSVDLNYVQVWRDLTDNCFSWEKTEINYENIRILKSTIDRFAAPNSAWERNHTDKDFNKRIEKLAEGKPSEAVKSLIGLGPGLTPSGDDVLLGFMAVVNTCDNFKLIRSTFRDEMLLNLKYTSDISASFLKMASENHYHEFVQDVLYSMVHGLPESVAISVRKLMGIGATSGTDIASGMYFGFLYM